VLPLPNLSLASTTTSNASGGQIMSPITGAALGVPDILIVGGVIVLAILIFKGRL
jgi:hypothetical protein